MMEDQKMKLKNIATTPPIGWNSWDCYGATVREDEVMGNAEYMAKHLLDYGWEYVVVDIQWYESAAVSSAYNAYYPLEMDEYSRLIPATNRFPSAKDGQGFITLGKKIHGLGLKFGIHIMRGIPRQAVHANTPILKTDKTARDIAHPNSICPWNTDMYGINPDAEGAQEYYNSIFELYASWGVDYVKVDDIAASRLYGIHDEEIKMIQKAIQNSGREMVLSLSPGPAPLEHAEILKDYANVWRMTDDYWDKWHYLYDMFERCEKWAPHVGPGSWPDCDMLPLGRIGIRSVDGFWDEPPLPAGQMRDRMTRFTKDEQKTMMSLWCIFRSPLMFGGDLRDNDEWTLSLLTNQELMDMPEKITKSTQVSRVDDLIIWHAQAEDAQYFALFNASDVDAEMLLDLTDYEFETSVLDIWSGEQIEFKPIMNFEVPKHGVVLLKMN